MIQRMTVLMVCLVVFTNLALAGTLESVGLDVGKPSLLGGAKPIAWLAAPANDWGEVEPVLTRYGAIVGFSTTTTTSGTSKETICRVLVALEKRPQALEQANEALRAKKLPTLRPLERAVVDVRWERFLCHWHTIQIPDRVPQLQQSVIRVGNKQRRFKIGGDTKSLARDLHRLSEACRNPADFTQASLGNDASYWLTEKPIGHQWMDLFSLRILSEAIGNNCEPVFEVRFFWKGSDSKPFNLPSEYASPWE